MHPPELRERALKAYATGKWTFAEVAEMFGVAVASLVRWRSLKKKTGSVKSTARRGGNPARVRPQDEALLRAILLSHNDFTVEEITVAFVTQSGRSSSRSSVGRALRKLGLTRKKSR